MAHRPVYARLSALVSLFLVTVASSVGGEAGTGRPRAGRRIRGGRDALADAGLLEGPRRDGRRGPVAAAPALGRGLGAGGSSGCSRRSRRSGPRGRPPRWRAWCPPRAARTGATPTPARGRRRRQRGQPPASTPNRSGSPRARSTWRPTGPASTTPSTSRTASRSSPRNQEKMIALGQQDVGEQKERPGREPPGRPRVLRRAAEARAAAAAARASGRPRRWSTSRARRRCTLPLTVVQPLRRHCLARGALLQPAFPRRAGAPRHVAEAAVVGGAVPRRDPSPTRSRSARSTPARCRSRRT